MLLAENVRAAAKATEAAAAKATEAATAACRIARTPMCSPLAERSLFHAELSLPEPPASSETATTASSLEHSSVQYRSAGAKLF